jgi:hypothetical protein
MKHPKRDDLENFGRAWARHLRQKTRLFDMARELFDGDQAIVDDLLHRQETVEAMSPLSVAVVVLSGWGASFDDDTLAAANCLRVTAPTTLEIH